MKRIYICIIILSALLLSCKSKPVNKESNEYNNKEQVSDKLTSIGTNKSIHDFGEISRGEIVVCSFRVKNTGKNMLIINKIETSCGCTTLNWDRKPIKPGKEKKIEVEFNSDGRYGKQYKVISIFANIPEKVKDLAVTATIK